RVDPDFVERLVERYDPSTGAMCVGAQIVSWDGERLDFGEGAVNFYGMGQQIGYGMPAASGDTEDGKEILFACGGAMLVNRRTFLDSGGFDDAFFAYFEDVDFGWRLWVLGFRVVFAAKARAYHKMHGTSSRFPSHQRFLLYERNALRTLLKNYDDVNLHRVLGPALMLLIQRTLMRGGGLNRPAYTIGGDTAETDVIDRVALAHLHAVGDIVADFDQIMESRTTIQRARKRGDDEVLAMFGRPFWPVLPQREYAELQERLITAFGLDDVMPKARASRVLIVANDPVAEKMSGPAIRAWEIAKALAGTADITVAVPVESTLEAPGVTLATYTDEASLFAIAQTADVILIQGYTIRKNPSLKRVPAVLVVDLYDPWLFENIELHTDEPRGDAALAHDAAVLNELLDEGDFFICASERQRDYWLGMLGGRDRLTQGQYAADPTLRMLIDVVPFGLPDRAPRHIRPVLKGVHPAVAADDLVVLWGGGTWDWFDPLSVIDAFKLVIEQVPNAKLYFLGFQLESSGAKVMRTAEMARRRAATLGLEGKSVIFGDWAPYDLREAYLLEADVAVTAVRDLAETRLSFRTRVLDYLWAKLPVVSTEGDVLSDLVRDERVGIVVPPGNAPALAAALVRLLKSPALRADCAANAGEVAKRFTWQGAVAPLRHVIAKPWQWDDARGLRPRGRRLTEETRALMDDKNRAFGTGSSRKLFPDIHFADLAAYVNHLENVVQMQERRLSLLRKTPIYPAFVAAKKVRNWRRNHHDG
ncbi:MAG: glycosyltransferase, partial [Mycobacteriales bacterium]